MSSNTIPEGDLEPQQCGDQSNRQTGRKSLARRLRDYATGHFKDQEARVETRKEQRRIRQVGDSTAGQGASHTIRKRRTEGCGELGFTESLEEHVLLRLLSGSVFSPHNPLHRVESLIERE